MSLITDSIVRTADTESALIPALATRWSPRGFDREAVIDEAVLTAALEAARWAPSASNLQPARFIVARRGSTGFAQVHAALMGFNRMWADTASVLIVNVAQLTRDDGTENPWARYDLGQAVAHLTIQAQHDGLHSHQLGGIDAAAIASAFGLADNQAVVSVTALGSLADVAAIPAELLERESAPRSRRPIGELVLAHR